MWNITPTNSTLLDDIKQCEGTLDYQTHIGTFKNGVFRVYNDSLNKPTIGYGHLVQLNESFKNGLLPDQADSLLAQDLSVHVNNAKAIYNQYNMTFDSELAQLVLAESVFQLGKNGLLQFKTFLTLMSQSNFKAAGQSLKSSKWYQQTPNRVQFHINRLNSI